jgi:radical SAM-linked protein
MPVPDTKSLQVFQSLLVSGPLEPEPYRALLEALEAERHLEHALALLKHARPDLALWGPALVQLKDAAARSRTRRMSLWQVDPHRRTLRLRFEVRGPACAMNPPALVASLARLLMDAGLPVAMGLEKNPRPAVHLGHPLPLGVEGWREWADAVLQEGPGLPMEALPAHVNAFAPEGLRVLQVALVPNFASPVSDLCRQGHWQWPCPEALLEQARERVAAFEAATAFEVERPGKVEGQKLAKRVDIRALLGGLQWEGPRLSFETRIGPGHAANPRKLLASILGTAPEDILGLARTEVELRPDPRLLQAEKFTPKLHNMYEDAVLLNSGSNIRIVEEDEDDPLILG